MQVRDEPQAPLIEVRLLGAILHGWASGPAKTDHPRLRTGEKARLLWSRRSPPPGPQVRGTGLYDELLGLLRSGPRGAQNDASGFGGLRNPFPGALLCGGAFQKAGGRVLRTRGSGSPKPGDQKDRAGGRNLQGRRRSPQGPGEGTDRAGGAGSEAGGRGRGSRFFHRGGWVFCRGGLVWASRSQSPSQSQSQSDPGFAGFPLGDSRIPACGGFPLASLACSSLRHLRLRCGNDAPGWRARSHVRTTRGTGSFMS